MATGAVAGLVGVTPAAGFVTPGAAMAIGSITALICYASMQIKVRLRFDDSLGTFAVHGVGGTVGALLTGVFASAALIESNPAGQCCPSMINSFDLGQSKPFSWPTESLPQEPSTSP